MQLRTAGDVLQLCISTWHTICECLINLYNVLNMEIRKNIINYVREPSVTYSHIWRINISNHLYKILQFPSLEFLKSHTYCKLHSIHLHILCWLYIKHKKTLWKKSYINQEKNYINFIISKKFNFKFDENKSENMIFKLNQI